MKELVYSSVQLVSGGHRTRSQLANRELLILGRERLGDFLIEQQ